MIVSLHLPKCAGTFWRIALENYFSERLYLDYGDWVGEESREAKMHRAKRFSELESHIEQLIPSIDCIHGHFYSPKWIKLIENPRFFTIFRNPFEAIPSAYAFMARNPQIDQPSVKEFHRDNVTLCEYIEMWPNQFSLLCAPMSVSDFDVIGITRDMKNTAALFNQRFSANIRLPEGRANHNPLGSSYQLSKKERQLISKYNQDDIELWKEAEKRFANDLKLLTQ